ncbi:LysR family transcriptional regulator [Lysobacter silvisoli]|uniref:LysR family transcriptional regulator n=1 Tax=Lysobacter silvisoli TaxID=2293254 RepID=A0A371K0M2_9GAMM|nr:LysR family transcriptional regulator [Lysobacter silvisoli]RDZ27400.1 LysR family transcriptional regulator [Lysobacter silvisoli]
MNEQGPDWDDYRYLLAVGRAGSLNGAAKRLGVSHPTVFRRINAIERKLGARLFERAREGYAATPAGEELLRIASELEERILDGERRLSGRDARPAGTLRVTTVEPILYGLLPPLLARFRREYPQIVLELTADNATRDLSRREADVALRPGGTPPDSLVGSRIAHLASAVYRPRAWRLREGADLSQLDWVVPDDSLSHTSLSRWARANGHHQRAVLRSNSLMTLRDAAAAGIGLAVLPCYMGDEHPRLARVGTPLPGVGADLWLLTHQDLRRTARVRVFLEAMRVGFAQWQDRLMGVAARD